MGFFDQLKDKASQAGEKAGAALKDAKSRMSEGMADAKAKMDEHKALAAEAKAPIEGSITRYHAVSGGIPRGIPEEAERQNGSYRVRIQYHAGQLHFQAGAGN